MKKLNIIKESKDFDKILKKKNQFTSKFTYIYINENDLNKYRFGICVSKKLGKAVIRNKIKRRIKDIIDKSKLQFNNKDYIIILKKSAKDAKYLELKEDIINLLKKNNE